MRVLVTGGAGFVAGHLKWELECAGYEVALTDVADCDLTDAVAVEKLVMCVRPDAIVHLGGISFVPDAAKDPTLLDRVNVGGTRNVLDAMLNLGIAARPDNLPAFVFISTAQVLNLPLSAYASSKLKAEAVVKEYVGKGVSAVIARSSNHTGPGQSSKFVVPSFVKQAMEIKAGMRKKFSVGNLDSIRDFTDVRDVARAYRLLLEKGRCGETYAIGSNNRMSMRQLLESVALAVGVSVDYEVNADFWRPTDESKVIDTSAIFELGWRAQRSFLETLKDMAEQN